MGGEDQDHRTEDFSFAFFADHVVLLESTIPDLSVGQIAVKCEAGGLKISTSKSEIIVFS